MGHGCFKQLCGALHSRFSRIPRRLELNVGIRGRVTSTDDGESATQKLISSDLGDSFRVKGCHRLLQRLVCSDQLSVLPSEEMSRVMNNFSRRPFEREPGSGLVVHWWGIRRIVPPSHKYGKYRSSARLNLYSCQWVTGVFALVGDRALDRSQVSRAPADPYINGFERRSHLGSAWSCPSALWKTILPRVVRPQEDGSKSLP
jgi:hypothetical protein